MSHIGQAFCIRGERRCKIALPLSSHASTPPRRPRRVLLRPVSRAAPPRRVARRSLAQHQCGGPTVEAGTAGDAVFGGAPRSELTCNGGGEYNDGLLPIRSTHGGGRRRGARRSGGRWQPRSRRGSASPGATRPSPWGSVPRSSSNPPAPPSPGPAPPQTTATRRTRSPAASRPPRPPTTRRPGARCHPAGPAAAAAHACCFSAP